VPSIHPSEDPALGLLVPCLAVADLQASLDFYARLDLLPYGGDIPEKWVMLRNRAIEIHLFQGHIPRDLLNFRGGNPDAIRAAMTERGLSITNEEGPRSFSYLDPDGREVFFDTCPEEEVAYHAGQKLTGEFPGDDVHTGEGMDLGNLTCCLNCADLDATRAFYEKLGLVPAEGDPGCGWMIMARRDDLPEPGRRLIDTYLSLFTGMIPTDMLNFRGGNVKAIALTLANRGLDVREAVKINPDGGGSLFLMDPDERAVFFDTTPPERLYAG
jgi:catechol 2,3-dioxygenase-like lactoylglutathione lyase family enzyme